MNNLFEEASPESQGVSSLAVKGLLDACEERGIELNSLMVIRHGCKIAEGWYKPYGPEIPHAMHSFTKSVSAMAMGIAEEEGFLSLNDRVISYFPDKLPLHVSENLKEMTIEHLLTMTCGHEGETQSFMGKDGTDYARCFLEQDVTYKPGTHFAYNTLGSDMLGLILVKATGLQMTEFLKPRLFDPLGISGYSCTRTHEGFEHTGGGLFLRTEDMARLGQLYLDRGKWNGRQLVPEAFVDSATRSHIRQERNEWNKGEELFAGYGYQLWLNTIPNSYRFDGFYGQLALVLPDQDMVVALTSSTMRIDTLLTLVWDCLLPSISDCPLPADEKAERALREKLGHLEIIFTRSRKRSAREKEIGGKKIIFPHNDYSMIPENRVWLLEREGVPSRGIEECSFVFDGETCRMTFRENGKETVLPLGMEGVPLEGVLNTPGLERHILALGTWLNDAVLQVEWRHYMSANHRYIQFDFSGEEPLVTFSETPNDIDRGTDFLYRPRKTFLCSLAVKGRVG